MTNTFFIFPYMTYTCKFVPSYLNLLKNFTFFYIVIYTTKIKSVIFEFKYDTYRISKFLLIR